MGKNLSVGGMLFNALSGGFSKTTSPVNPRVMSDFSAAVKANPGKLTNDFTDSINNGELNTLTNNISNRDADLAVKKINQHDEGWNTDFRQTIGLASRIGADKKPLYPEARLALVGALRELGIEDARLLRENAAQGPMKRTVPEGAGSKLAKQGLREEVGDTLIAAGAPYTDATSAGKLRRQELFDIQSDKRGPQRVSGTDGFLKHYVETGELQPEMLKFGSKDSAAASAKKRYDATRPPEEALRKEANLIYPKDPELATQYVDEYLKWTGPSFAMVQEASRRTGISLRERLDEIVTGQLTDQKAPGRTRPGYDAGHPRAAQGEADPRIELAKGHAPDSPINRPATEGYGARIEERSANRGGRNYIEHDINPYAAKRAGIPLNWKDSFHMWLDRKLGTNKYPNWTRDFSTDEVEIIFNIPNKAEPPEVDKIFEAFIDARKHNPKWMNMFEEMEAIRKDIEEEPTLGLYGVEKGEEFGDTPAEIANQKGFTQKEKDAFDLERKK